MTWLKQHAYIKIAILRRKSSVRKGFCSPWLPQAHFIMCEIFHHAVLVESHSFCTMHEFQVSFYCPLGYNSRVQCPLLQCLHTTSAIVVGKHSYFVISSLKCEGKNCSHDLIPNPCVYLYTRWACHASLLHSVVAWMRNISVPENYGFDTIICDYFYRSPFPTSHLYGC